MIQGFQECRLLLHLGAVQRAGGLEPHTRGDP